jgi:hypothetical protein
LEVVVPLRGDAPQLRHVVGVGLRDVVVEAVDQHTFVPVLERREGSTRFIRCS